MRMRINFVRGTEVLYVTATQRKVSTMPLARLIYIGTRLLLGIVFVMSGVLKLISPQAAADFLDSIVREAPQITIALVRFLSILECVLGCLIIGGKKEEYTSVIATMSFPVFSIVGLLFGSPDQACGCFGDFSQSRFDEYFLIRNTILMFFSMYLIWYSHRTPKPPGEPQ
jgi:uncharacterized membrane protein YphA (DoxX/SURF4 family)